MIGTEQQALESADAIREAVADLNSKIADAARLGVAVRVDQITLQEMGAVDYPLISVRVSQSI
jgi:hypothetical protein